MSDVTCEDCGSTYDVSWEHVPFRDKDSYDCDVCGSTLKRWNGSSIPKFTLKERGEKTIAK